MLHFECDSEPQMKFKPNAKLTRILTATLPSQDYSGSNTDL